MTTESNSVSFASQDSKSANPDLASPLRMPPVLPEPPTRLIRAPVPFVPSVLSVPFPEFSELAALKFFRAQNVESASFSAASSLGGRHSPLSPIPPQNFRHIPFSQTTNLNPNTSNPTYVFPSSDREFQRAPPRPHSPRSTSHSTIPLKNARNSTYSTSKRVPVPLESSRFSGQSTFSLPTSPSPCRSTDASNPDTPQIARDPSLNRSSRREKALTSSPAHPKTTLHSIELQAANSTSIPPFRSKKPVIPSSVRQG